MQGLTKSPTGISKFVPHSTSVTDRKSLPPADTVPVLRPERFDPLAHDTRNVLSALKLYCDLLAEPGIPPQLSERLQLLLELAASLRERLDRPEPSPTRQIMRAPLRPMPSVGTHPASAAQ